MKTTLLLAASLLSLSLNLSADRLPPDAEALKAKRDAKIAEINQLYAEALGKLQKKAMAEGNLESAKLLEDEIAKATPDPFFKPEQRYENTVWAWGSGGELTLEKGGKATHSKWSRSGKWKVEGDAVIVESDAGTKFKVMFESDDAAQVISTTGGKSTSLVKK